MSEILAEATFPSVIHNNEVCEEIVKWAIKMVSPCKKQNYIIKWMVM